jgi:hypothetical protein
MRDGLLHQRDAGQEECYKLKSHRIILKVNRDKLNGFY